MTVLPSKSEALLQRIEWTVLRRLNGALHGEYGALFNGCGIELAGVRDYRAGDDVRRIDWNTTARLHETYVREYIEERQVTAWFLLDLSPSLDFGSQQVPKRALAEDFFAFAASALTRRGNRVGAIMYGDAVDTVIEPRMGPRHIRHVLETMLARPARASAGATDLTKLLGTAEHIVRDRSLVFVISDFISAPGWGDVLARLAQRHDATAVQLSDPLELEMPDLGMIMMQDAETAEQLLVDTGDDSFRIRYRAAARKRELAVCRTLRDAGVETLQLSTSDDLAASIIRYAGSRRERARRGVRMSSRESQRTAA